MENKLNNFLKIFITIMLVLDAILIVWLSISNNSHSDGSDKVAIVTKSFSAKIKNNK